MSATTCHHCGSSELDHDPARGDTVCTNCGAVLDDNLIVAEVQFEENAHGSSAVGQFVSADGKYSRSLGEGFHTGIGRESRAVTHENGRRRINEVAGQLRLKPVCVDMAFNLFKMAVHKRLTRGRKNSHVIAACLYIACRLEGSALMLLDFSDVLQVNVYELGKAYLKLSSALCINIPSIDPCIYICRFANHLQFAGKTIEVSNTAHRLVQRMKRDWMHTGRRPSGLCGAALLVAARLHNFNRTTRDIIKVVKVCEATIRKRLNEFGDTPSSRLTLDEFLSIDLEEQEDPPAFKASRKKARLQQLEEQQSPIEQDYTNEVSSLQMEIEKAIEERHKKVRGQKVTKDTSTPDDVAVNKDREQRDAAEFVEQETMSSITEFLFQGGKQVPTTPTSVSRLVQEDKENEEGDDEEEEWRSSIRGLGPTAASLGLKQTIEECMAVQEVQSLDTGTGELDLTGIDEDELDSYIMTEEEVKRKTDMWLRLNKDYLEQLKIKEEKAAKEREENAGKEKKKRRTVKKKQAYPASSAGEAMERMLQERKISSKINYEVLRSLNSDFAAPGASTAATTAVNQQNPEAVDAEGEGQPLSSNPTAVDSSNTRIAESPLRDKEKEPTAATRKRKEPEVESVQVADNLPVEVTTASDIVSHREEMDIEEENLEDEDDVEDEPQLSAMQLLRRHMGEEGEEEADIDYDQDDY